MSDKINELARRMRERALLMTASPELSIKELEGNLLEIEKRNQLQRVEQMKKLYFNAGRWSGGSRDHIAREAFEKVNGK
jgi:hypothetical protein|tara:strand:- start:1108 stop:1344 length:237 start_codon:yes stop_codon:yes gene_type:complete